MPPLPLMDLAAQNNEDPTPIQGPLTTTSDGRLSDVRQSSTSARHWSDGSLEDPSGDIYYSTLHSNYATSSHPRHQTSTGTPPRMQIDSTGGTFARELLGKMGGNFVGIFTGVVIANVATMPDSSSMAVRHVSCCHSSLQRLKSSRASRAWYTLPPRVKLPCALTSVHATVQPSCS